jgi:hypothetical protein
VECPFEDCRKSLKPWNAATNFQRPSLAVERAIDAALITPNAKVLEFGSGNLRNALHTMRTLSAVQYHVVEMAETISRFADIYKRFEGLGGHILRSRPGARSFDVTICTFVIETICPSSKRVETLHSIAETLAENGTLVASFRGYPGVKGTRYRKCQLGDGLISPRMTFVKPFSISEVENLLHQSGFNKLKPLEKYRTNQPQNIHMTATLRGQS